ncbi:endonuclease IV [compost metagenome]
MFPYGQRRDRHAGIGQGCIGEEKLRELLLSEPFRRAAVAMETAKGTDGSHRREIAAVQNWYEAEEQP